MLMGTAATSVHLYEVSEADVDGMELQPGECRAPPSPSKSSHCGTCGTCTCTGWHGAPPGECRARGLDLPELLQEKAELLCFIVHLLHDRIMCLRDDCLFRPLSVLGQGVLGCKGGQSAELVSLRDLVGHVDGNRDHLSTVNAADLHLSWMAWSSRRLSGTFGTLQKWPLC